MNTSVDGYFLDGCGRCPLGSTPDCKVHNWTRELKLLREIVLSSGLNEESKWGAPCYTFQDKNILMIGAFKKYCCISFFKGALLNDEQKLLVKPGPNSQAARLFRFESIEAIEKIEAEIKHYIMEAIEVKAGLKVQFEMQPESMPEELLEKFIEDPTLKTAFEVLTPGRQRGYILHFSQAKQSKTRRDRIEKCTPMILSGIGLNDKYKSIKKK